MTEDAVKLVAMAVVEAYEEKTGLPRHKENVEKLDKLIGAWNWIKGAAWTFGTIWTVFEVWSRIIHKG